MADAESPVLIVGGGPVGLATSILCSYHGIRLLLVEQHAGTSIYLKARMINARWMEIMRQVGLAIAPHTGARLAEFGFLLLLIAGIWMVAAEVPALNLGNLKGIGAGILLAVGGLLLIIATHWGHFG